MTTPPPQPDSAALDRAVEAVRNTPIPDGPSDAVLAQTLARLSAAPFTLPERRPLMPRLLRLAAALALIAGVGALLYLVSHSGTPAFADVVKNFRDAKTLTFTSTVPVPNVKEPMVMTFFMTGGGRTRVQMPDGQVTISDMPAGRSLTIDPKLKTAILITFDPKGRGPERAGAADFLDEFKRLDDKAAKPLGEKVIDGKPARGFATDQGAMKMEIWADKATNRPIRMDVRLPLYGGETTMTMSDFVFDAPLDPALFDLDAPKGYELQKIAIDPNENVAHAQANDVKASEDTLEPNVIGLLKEYAARNAGAFPDRLDDWSALWLAGNPNANPFKGGPDAKTPATTRPATGPAPQLTESDVRMMSYAGALTAHLLALPKDDWAYHGKGVKLNAKDTIVFWYRHPETKALRAIRADLTAIDVSPEMLPKR
ncbi:MAG TPA: hypothetical protein VEA69_08995 [Tepidisphaeraceae bacterium]|nr:hypothetical protein [Tepidisphaeraceae bacterium]